MRSARVPILTLVVLPVLVLSCETRDGGGARGAWVCPTEAQHFTAHGQTRSTIPMSALPDGSPPTAGHEMLAEEYVEIPLPPHGGRVTVAIVAASTDHYSVVVERSARWEPVGEIGPRTDMPLGLFRQPEVDVAVGDAQILSLYAHEPGRLAQICVRAEESRSSPWLWLILGIGVLYLVLRLVPRPAAQRWAAMLGRADPMVATMVGAAALEDPVVLGLLLPAWVALRARDPVSPSAPPEPRFGIVERLSIGALIVGAFAVYAASGTEVVGGCDSWSYLSQALWLRGAALDMSQPDPGAHPALVPLCHALVDGEVRSIFPPGFPVMLAPAGVFGLEFLVNPLLGATGVGLVYALLARRAGHGVALVTAALWASAPIAIWGSVRLMSDLPATVLMLASLYALMRGRGAIAGVVAGLTCGLRPASVFFGLAVAPRVFEKRAGRSFYAGMAVGGALWILFLLATLGPPWDSPYTGYSGNMLAPHAGYFAQVGFYLHTIARFHPLMLCLAALALYHRSEGSRTYLLWFLVFILFYGFWTRLLHAWWETRFVLPSYAALHLLGGLGLAEVIHHPRWERARRGLPFKVAAVLAVGGSLVFQGLYARVAGLLDSSFERGYRTDSERVAELTDPRSVVAAVNFTGPLRIYGHRASFLAAHFDAPRLIDAALDEPRPVYAVLEAFERPAVEASPGWRGRYELVEVEPLTMWAALELRRVLPVVEPPGEPGDTVRVAELTVASSGGVSGDPRRAADGARPPDGSDWDGEGAVALDDLEATIVFRVPDDFTAEAVELTADGNDAYAIESSVDGLAFVPLAVLPAVPQYGLRTRRASLDGAPVGRFVRVRAIEGDDRYSVAELRLLGTPPRLRVGDARGETVGELARLVDGVAPADGAAWDGPDSVRIAPDASVTFRLPPGNVTGLRVTADGNDTYVVEGSTDGERFAPTGEAPPTGSGMRTRTVRLDRAFRWVRVTPGEGDGLCSIGEVAPILSTGTVVDLASASPDDGWAVDDAAVRFAARRASLRPTALARDTMYRVTLTIRADATVPESASIAFTFDGTRLERHRLAREDGVYHLVVPGRLVRGDGEDVLGFELDDTAAEHGGAIVVRRVLFEAARLPPLAN